MTNLNGAKQQADDDLTWLARNVHEWPVSGNFTIQLFCNLHGNTTLSSKSPNGASHTLIGEVTKTEWLARRAELQNKPSWDYVPSDIEYMAQEPNGAWGCWYDKPKPDEDINNNGDAVWCWAGNRPAKDFNIVNEQVGKVLGDWRDTLERRPQAAKSEPSSDDWHKRGGLPPVGTECEVLLDGMWERVFIVGFSRQGQPVIENRFGAVYECINCQFRPLQTERERIASELVDVMMAVPVSDRKTASESFMSMALAIYDHLHQESKS